MQPQFKYDRTCSRCREPLVNDVCPTCDVELENIKLAMKLLADMAEVRVMAGIKCYVTEGVLGRWIVVNADDNSAWSGWGWVSHNRGIPTGVFQVSNFGSKDEAIAYAKSLGFDVLETVEVDFTNGPIFDDEE